MPFDGLKEDIKSRDWNTCLQLTSPNTSHVTNNLKIFVVQISWSQTKTMFFKTLHFFLARNCKVSLLLKGFQFRLPGHSLLRHKSIRSESELHASLGVGTQCHLRLSGRSDSRSTAGLLWDSFLLSKLQSLGPLPSRTIILFFLFLFF